MKKLKRLQIRKLLEESIRREKGKNIIHENIKRQQRWYNSILNESLLTGSADAMGDFIMVSTNGKVIRSPNTVKGVAKATSKAIFTNNTIPKGCKGLYRVIGVDGGEAVLARVSVKTGKVLTKTGFAETIKVSKDAISRSSVLYMNGLRGTEYKITTDTGKIVAQTSKGTPAVVSSNSTSQAAKKAIQNAEKLLPMEKIIDTAAPESSLAVHTNATKAIAPPPASQVAATEKMTTALTTTPAAESQGTQRLASVASSSASSTPDDLVAAMTSELGEEYFKKGASKLANSPELEKAIIKNISQSLSEQGFKDVSQETLKKMAQAQAAGMSDDALAELGKQLGVKASAAAETGLAKTGAQAAETGLTKTGAQTTSKTAIQTASGTTELVVKDFAEGAIEKGAQIAKGAPQLETALTQQIVNAGSGEISEEVAKQGAHGLLGSLPGEEVAEIVAKNAGQESTEVAVSASGKFVTGLAKALGPAIVLAFGFYELYNAFTNEEYNDEEFYNALAIAAGNMTIGFGTLAIAAPAGAGLALTLGVAFGATIAATAAGGAGYFLIGKPFNDFMTVDTNDLFVSVGRQAADKVGVLDTGMFTKWHEENEWAQDFIDAAAKKDFKGLNPKDIDEKRRSALFNLLAIERIMMLNGEKLSSATGENAKIAKKLRSLFDKGFLNAETWYPEFKKLRKAAEKEISVKPPSGGEENKKIKNKGKETISATKESEPKNKMSWEYYISKTGDAGNKVKSGFEELASAGKVNDGNYKTWLDFYNQMRKDPQTMKAIGAKTGSHLSPNQIIKIYDFIMGKSENLKENLFLDDLLWESNIRRKIIKSQKIINLID